MLYMKLYSSDTHLIFDFLSPSNQLRKVADHWSLFLMLLLLSGCAAKKPFYKYSKVENIEIPKERIDYEVVILGNVGYSAVSYTHLTLPTICSV